jgi:hypothetical protein
MKNPRTLLAAGDVPTMDDALKAAVSQSGPVLAPVTDKKGDSAIQSLLKFSKLTPDEIQRIDDVVGAVSKMASMANWVIGAITTVKQVLVFLELLHPDTDPTLKALKAIGAKLQQIYGYLATSVITGEYKDSVDWRADLGNVRAAVQNIAVSRSPANITNLVQTINPFQKNIVRMLSEAYASIPFLRSPYKYDGSYTLSPFLPSHWIDYAMPYYMKQRDGTPVQSYADPSLEMVALIWDPAYYVDVLVQSIALRVTALALMEPAFRSTGFFRLHLKDIYSGLDAFIRKWEGTMLRTQVVGPLSPDPSIGHKISHPYRPWGSSPGANGIPLGAIDPVSGISALETNYNQGFQLVLLATTPNPEVWGVANFSEAVVTATARRDTMESKIHDACGIDTFYRLRDNIFDLIMGPRSSEFVHLSPVQVRAPGPIPGVPASLIVEEVGQETATLGTIGDYAGAPGKTYALTRYVEYNAERVFRIPMARRMDVSGIQLGYTITVDMTDGEKPREIELCPFSTDAQGAIFPKQSIAVTLQSDTANVYDVYQSRLFSAADEEDYENHGSFHDQRRPGRIIGTELPTRRLYLNRRKGKVRVQVTVDFDLPAQDPDVSFIGSAKVTVRSLDPNQYREGYILSFEVLETVMSATGVDALDDDVRMIKLADSMTLHLAPSFLIAPQGFFADREAGLERIHDIVPDISNRYALSQPPLVHVDPMHQVEAISRQEEATLTLVKQFREQFPEQEAALMQRFQNPTIERGRNSPSTPPHTQP